MKNIKNIIFDFGEVIININPDAVRKRMAEKGILNVDELHAKLFESKIYHDLETGALGSDEFRSAVKNIIDLPLTYIMNLSSRRNPGYRGD